MEDFFREVRDKLPWVLKFTAWGTRRSRPFRWLVEQGTRMRLGLLARRKDGSLHWIRFRDQGKISAYFGSMETWKNIPDWSDPVPGLDLTQAYRSLDHGYREDKPALALSDLQQAAEVVHGHLRIGRHQAAQDFKVSAFEIIADVDAVSVPDFN